MVGGFVLHVREVVQPPARNLERMQSLRIVRGLLFCSQAVRSLIIPVLRLSALFADHSVICILLRHYQYRTSKFMDVVLC